MIRGPEDPDDAEPGADPDIFAAAPDADAIKASWMWGSSTRLSITNNGDLRASSQLAQVSLPEPAVCTIYVQASARVIVGGVETRVSVFTINLLEGVGRVTIPRQITFMDQPATDAPLEFTMPWVPLHALQVNVEAIGAGFGPTDEISIEVFFELSPLTRIPQKDMPLEFGMAQPGEADSMDDELREELQAESPTVEQILTTQPDEDDEPELELEQPPTPRELAARRIAANLTARFGRQPSREELRAALARVDARRARRRARAAPAAAPAGRNPVIERVIAVLTQQFGRRPTKPEVRLELERLRLRGGR